MRKWSFVTKRPKVILRCCNSVFSCLVYKIHYFSKFCKINGTVSMAQLKENCPQVGETWNTSGEIMYYLIAFPCIQTFIQSLDNFLAHLLHAMFFPSRYWPFLSPKKQHKEVNSYQYKQPSAWKQYLTSILCPIPFRSLIYSALHCKIWKALCW